jgi:putative oxidoreductase
MTRILALNDRLGDWLARLDTVLPLMARLVFAAVLAMYFWASGLTKLEGGSLSTGAYAQIFPRVFEAVGYDSSQLSWYHTVVVAFGTLAEFILPALIILGLLTRLAAIGMIGFIIVQSLTDLFGHGGLAHAATLGRWFDRVPDAVIMDQRLLWVMLLVILVVKGGGALALDRVISPRR